MKNVNEDTRTVVISTLDDRARERVRRIQSHLAVAGFRNVDVVQARTPERENFQELGLPDVLQGRWRTDLRHMWGSAACSLSHLDLMSWESTQLPIIILEDDATIHPQFFRYLAAIDFPEQHTWDICHLSYYNDNFGSTKHPAGVLTKHLVSCVPNLSPGTYSYLLNRPIFDRITPLSEEIDCHLAYMTDCVHSFVIEHDPPLTMPDFDLPSVREELDAIYWRANNPEAPAN